MSKRELSKYLTSLSKKELEEQIQELYDRLKEVKEFYNFVFNPKEEVLLEEAKFKIGKEYFPPSGRKPKKRRSVAQKYIKTFLKLGVNPIIIADVMLYNIEVAQTYNQEIKINQESFYKSMFVSFKEAIEFISDNGLRNQFDPRITQIISTSEDQQWINSHVFQTYL